VELIGPSATRLSHRSRCPPLLHRCHLPHPVSISAVPSFLPRRCHATMSYPPLAHRDLARPFGGCPPPCTCHTPTIAATTPSPLSLSGRSGLPPPMGPCLAGARRLVSALGEVNIAQGAPASRRWPCHVAHRACSRQPGRAPCRLVHVEALRWLGRPISVKTVPAAEPAVSHVWPGHKALFR
jgi:hypothetical protein